METQNRPEEAPRDEKIDFEEDRTRGGEKKDNKDDKKRQYELSKCFDRV